MGSRPQAGEQQTHVPAVTMLSVWLSIDQVLTAWLGHAHLTQAQP